MFWLISAFVLTLTIFLDYKWRVLTKTVPGTAGMLVAPHMLLWYNLAARLPGAAGLPFKILSIVLPSYFLARFYINDLKHRKELPLRLRIMTGGRKIFLMSAAAMAMQIPLFIALFLTRGRFSLPPGLLAADIAVTSVLSSVSLLNGAVRIFLTSKRLGIFKRVLILLLSWVPGVNLVMGLYLCRTVKKEYLTEVQKKQLQDTREESQTCATKYPLLMLHGIGFRDYEYVNYWGRIPVLLKKNGAVVEYGKQQAWGTIEGNAAGIKEQLLKFLEETGAEKVNIIAHSKGGLDARYMISSLGMADKVASLTTISTPHRGSELVDVLSGMKESRYRKICNTLNKTFKRLGDPAPDAYNASKQLKPEYLEKFNKENPDMPGVFYQSYASEMKNPSSHALLSIPQAIMKFKAGTNDGLVTIESAKWGEFKGTLKSSDNRGISHADQIDLMRKDYDGFNIAEEYVKIVSKLKEKGF